MEGDQVMYRGRLFQVRAAAIGNTWSSAVERRVRWTVKLYSGIIGPIGCFWTAMTWCRLHSLRTNSSQHQDRRDDGVQRHAYRGWWWWSSVRPVSAWFVSGFFDTVDHDLLMLWLDCHSSVWSQEMPCSNGSAHTCLAERFMWYIQTARHQSSTFHVPYHNVQSMLSPHLLILYTVDLGDHVSEHELHLLMTRSYICCLQEVGYGCLPTISSRIRIKRELLWARLGHGRVLFGSSGPSSWLWTETIAPSDQVRQRYSQVRPRSDAPAAWRAALAE